MRTVSPSSRAELAKLFLDAHLPQRSLEARQRLVGIEIRHRGEPLDALAGNDERAVVAALDRKGIRCRELDVAPAAARRSPASVPTRSFAHTASIRSRTPSSRRGADAANLGKASPQLASSDSRAFGRSSLLSTSSVGFSSSAGFHARELRFDRRFVGKDFVERLRAVEQDAASTRVRSTCLRN